MELKTTLNEKLTEKFLVVKENTCMKDDKSVLAFLISQAYEKVQETKCHKIFVAQEVYDILERKAEAEGLSVEVYVSELVEDQLKKAKERVKHGNLSRN